jgi:hypothetical protein
MGKDKNNSSSEFSERPSTVHGREIASERPFTSTPKGERPDTVSVAAPKPPKPKD